MTRWIEEHAYVLLRLMLRHRRAQSDRVGDGGGQVIHRNVEVHHHLLVAVGGRPDRGHIVRRELERQVGRVAWYGYGRLAGLQLRYRPAKQANIEVGKRPRVGGLEHDAPPGSFGPSTHSHIMSASAGRPCHHGVHQQLAEADDRPRWHHDHRVAWLDGTVLLRAGCPALLWSDEMVWAAVCWYARLLRRPPSLPWFRVGCCPSRPSLGSLSVSGSPGYG